MPSSCRDCTRPELYEVVGHVALDQPACAAATAHDVSERAAYSRAAVHIVLFAAAAAVLLVAVLHSIAR